MSLQAFGLDNLPSWMDSMFEVLGQRILFVTHPDDAGSADTGPLFRLKPTQVVAYELFSVTRHVDNDADLGDGASVTIHRLASVDVEGNPELSSLISGSFGLGQADTNVRYLQDEVTAGAPQLDLGYNVDSGIITGNTMPGIWTIPISLDSFGDEPEVEIESHTHEDNSEGGQLGLDAYFTTDTSFSGSIAVSGRVSFALNPFTFWPMVHMSSKFNDISCHGTDGGGPDATRFILRNSDGSSSHTYDLDARNIDE